MLQLSGLLTTRLLKSGEALCRQGDTAAACYFVQRGELTLCTREEHPDEAKDEEEDDEEDGEEDGEYDEAGEAGGGGRGGRHRRRRNRGAAARSKRGSGLWHNRRHQSRTPSPSRSSRSSPSASRSPNTTLTRGMSLSSVDGAGDFEGAASSLRRR